MKHIKLLKVIHDEIEDDINGDLSYNSLIEEAIKLCQRSLYSSKPLIVIKENAYLASRLYEILISYFDEDELVYYNPEESLRSEEIASSFENRAERILSLYKIANLNSIKIVLTTPYGFIRHLPSIEFFKKEIINIKKNDIVDRDQLIKRILKLGYEKTNHVENPMTYAARGFIVDVFSVNCRYPIRIEFFDDEIESIRYFDVNSQTTIEEIENATIIPAKDVFFSEEDKRFLIENVECLSSQMELNIEYIKNDIYEQNQYIYTSYFKNMHLIDYIDAVIYLSDENNINSHLDMLINETVAYIQEMNEAKKIPLRFYVYGDFQRLMLNKNIIKGLPYQYNDSNIVEINIPSGSLDYVLNIINSDSAHYKVLAVNQQQCELLVKTLLSMNITYNILSIDRNSDCIVNKPNYSIKTDIESHKYIELNNDIFEGLSQKELDKTFKKYMKANQLFNNVIFEKYCINIDNQTLDEIQYSNYSKWLKNNMPIIYGDKLRVAIDLTILLKASFDWKIEKPKHKRKDSIVKFARGIVIYKGFYSEYKADILLGLDSSDNIKLYDLVNIQETIIKRGSSSNTLNIITDKGENTETASSINNISYPNNTTLNINEGINVCVSDIYYGFELPSIGLKIYTDRELFNSKIKIGKFASKYSEATKLDSYEDLKKGDYVVHDQYGIGQFIDIETKEINGISLDYLKIIYKGNDELLVPLSQFHLVRKYVSKEGIIPKLHKLGSKEWSETKKRVEENVEGIAGELMDIYAERESCVGFSFNKDDEIQKQFEKEFIYDLTEDQIKAIREVKKDMESNKPMDRLLCGDVGFGKTEVAMRASLKACLSNKQVVYLCPTTILSLQHYKTFIDRFSNYPVRIELINRFVDTTKQKEIINDLLKGKIDILIGTHRVLSDDIKFKDLGLLIIDEEQRFGVKHKEKIKNLKRTIDVLSLSATPIPRTLQMSLIGIRGLSTLNTPPLNRYPVQTYVAINNRNLIKEVILRELERKGQVFYLYNNVSEIYNVARRLQDEIPFAKVDVTHGQMSSEQIEDVMFRFYNNDIDVLICTTIVETGLDIPNANTIIIDNAQNFGLAQLYQIKGRVGRSDRVAYAYLLIPENKNLNETSSKRLNAIKEFTNLGSGFKIAMRDLTIRGAGDILGAKQSGFIDNVGLDLYLSMLGNAIKKRKGEKIEEVKEKKSINIPMSAYIPDSFDENDYEKLSIYHELELIDNKEDLLKYYAKVCDEYGKLPDVVKALFDKKRINLLFNLELIDSILNRDNMFKIIFTKKYSDSVDGVRFFEYCNEISPDMIIRYKNSKLEVSVPFKKETIDKILMLVDNLDKLEKKNED